MTATNPAFLVTIVYWILLASSSTFATPFSGMSAHQCPVFDTLIQDYSLVQYLQARFELGLRRLRDLPVKY
jgi:hypothetical protein